MNLEIYRTLYENFDTNTNIDYERLADRYKYYLMQFIRNSENKYYKNMFYLENIVSGMNYVNMYFSLENNFNSLDLNDYVEKKKIEIINSYKNKEFNLGNSIYFLTSECYKLFDNKNNELNEMLILIMVKNCYIIEKVLQNNTTKKTNLS